MLSGLLGALEFAGQACRPAPGQDVGSFEIWLVLTKYFALEKVGRTLLCDFFCLIICKDSHVCYTCNGGQSEDDSAFQVSFATTVQLKKEVAFLVAKPVT